MAAKIKWDEIRRLFPATGKFAYLNAAGGSPISTIAANEGKRFYDEILERGDLYWDEWMKRVADTREKLAHFINADNSELTFTLSTSHGMNLIADMLRGRGDIVTMKDEFPSSTPPWLHRKCNVTFVEPENYGYSIETIARSVDGQTKIIVTSYVQYSTGFRQNLVELGNFCKSRGLIYVVNATQAIGAMPIDVREANIDFLVFASLKWPMAGYGIGGLFINRKWLDQIEPPVVGWQSVEDPDAMDNNNYHLKNSASALEVGCPHFSGIFALGGALDLLNQIGQENIQERIFYLNDILVDKLKKLKLEIISPLERGNRSGITVVKIPNAKEISQRLAKRGIIVSERKNGLRISIHIYNNEKDIDRLITGLGEVL